MLAEIESAYAAQLDSELYLEKVDELSRKLGITTSYIRSARTSDRQNQMI